MQIIHKKDDFLYTIFPRIIPGNEQSIITALEDYYSYGPFKPKVIIENDIIRVEIDTTTIDSQDSDHKTVISLCENNQTDKAKTILAKLIIQNPTNSEFHRTMGQILSIEGNQDEAINSLIDALRWDSKNSWALLMMGNIFAKFKGDLPTSMKYYDQALIANPKDHITVNNIGASLLQQGKIEEAKKYLSKALILNQHYPNTHFALGMIAKSESDLVQAFDHFSQALKWNSQKDELYETSIRQSIEVAQQIVKSTTGQALIEKYKNILELKTDRRIEIEIDEKLDTAAKFEFAENHHREFHLVKYKSQYPAVEHLIMHELVHLDLVIHARLADSNQLYVTNEEHKSKFINRLQPTINQFKQIGIAEETIANYCSNLFDGLNRQVFNAPLDLYIENKLFKEFPSLRPFQFLSLYSLLQEGLQAVTNTQIVELSPKEILSKSKIYNILNALQFKELYGIDIIIEFQSTQSELKLALSFFEEYQQSRDHREPGQEYELVLHWAQELQLNDYFELIPENEYRNKNNDIDNLLANIENDPFDLNYKDNDKQRETDLFIKNHQETGTNMVVVLFMVEALRFFDGKSKESIKEIAFDIATQGTQGFRPDYENYHIPSIKNKSFSGYEILAYYYISWSLAIPEMLPQLQLPFENEYNLALTLYNS